MKSIIFLLLMLTSCLIFSQEQEQEPIRVIEDARLPILLRNFKNRVVVQKQQFTYQIQLISSYQRNAAYSTKSKFQNMHPSEPCVVNHDGVKFTTRAGKFSSKEEAEYFLQQIRSAFPASFVLPPEEVKP